MAVEHPTPDVIAVPRTGVAHLDQHSYVDWSSILAGAAIAVAMSTILIAFGSAIGLAVTSPWSPNSASATTMGLAAAVFVALVQLWAISSGAYLSGRLRPKAHDSIRDEVRFRDGISGLVVWALAVLLSTVIASSILSSGVRSAGQVASAVAGSTASALAPVAERSVDLAFRAAQPSGDDAQAQAVRKNLPELTQAERTRVNRIIVDSLSSGELDPQDRAYVSRLVAEKTGVAPQAAEARVTEVYNQASASAKEAVETAKNVAAFAGFWTALVFLLSGMGAWWAGSLGGAHRDEGTIG